MEVPSPSPQNSATGRSRQGGGGPGASDARSWGGLPSWGWWSVLTLVSWGIWAILSKAIGNDLTAAEIQIVSTLGILPVVVVLGLVPRAVETELHSSNRRGVGIALALAAGTVSAAGNIPYYQLLSQHAATAVVPLASLYPLVTVLLAVPILGERLNAPQTIGIGMSLLAIYFFNVQTEDGIVSSWLLAALVPIGLWGAAGLLQKMATNHISGSRSAFWFLMAFVIGGAVMAIFDPLPSGVAWRNWLLAAAVGFTLALGNFTILVAFARGGKAAIITPLTALYPLISIPIAIAVWSESLNGRTVLGIVCAILAVVLLAWESVPSSTKSADELTATRNLHS